MGIVIIILLIIIIFLLLRSCGKSGDQGGSFGDYEITDSVSISPNTSAGTNQTGTITFAGFCSYKVSQDSPKIRLENPAANRVEMAFTLTDKKSGTLIVKTEKIQPGKYVYINIMEFYPKSGVYDVLIEIATFDPVTGQEKNGLEQTIQIQVT